MNQFAISIVLAVVISSLTTYFITTMSLQNTINENKNPITSAGAIVEINNRTEANMQTINKDKSPLTAEITKIELSCSEACGDDNPCTYYYCNEATNFKCEHSILKGEVEGCKGMVEGSCYKYSCVLGSCTLIYSSACCGNGKCDADENYSLCPGDCEQPTVQSETTQTTTTQQTLSLVLAISVANNPIVRGNEQTITLKVTGGGNAIEGASISCTVTYASGTTTKDCGGTTNINGEHSYIWRIGSNSSPGTFSVTATASKSGYDSGSASTSFQVTTASG